MNLAQNVCHPIINSIKISNVKTSENISLGFIHLHCTCSARGEEVPVSLLHEHQHPFGAEVGPGSPDPAQSSDADGGDVLSDSGFVFPLCAADRWPTGREGTERGARNY